MISTLNNISTKDWRIAKTMTDSRCNKVKEETTTHQAVECPSATSQTVRKKAKRGTIEMTILTSKQFSDGIKQLMASPVWHDDGACKLYQYCLSQASRNYYEWKGQTIQPGDLPFSERHAAGTLQWSRNKLRRKLDILESLGLITLQSVQWIGTMLHIVDWPFFEADSCCHDRYDMNEYEPDRSQTEQQTEQERFQNPENRQQLGSAAAHNIIYKKNKYTYNDHGSEAEPAGFSKIWLAYPEHRRGHRNEAANLVAKALEEGATIENILAALESDKQKLDWQMNDGQYIPGIVKWLQRETWRKYSHQENQDQPEEDEEAWVTW